MCASDLRMSATQQKKNSKQQPTHPSTINHSFSFVISFVSPRVLINFLCCDLYAYKFTYIWLVFGVYLLHSPLQFLQQKSNFSGHYGHCGQKK